MKIAILKAGSIFDQTKKNYGDFEDWTIQGIDIQKIVIFVFYQKGYLIFAFDFEACQD
jgi:hypothetical protein